MLPSIYKTPNLLASIVQVSIFGKIHLLYWLNNTPSLIRCKTYPSDLFWLHGSSVEDMRSKRGMMLPDLHYKTHWEQHDRQSFSLASTTHQTLDKTCPCSVDPWSSRRCNSQPFRSNRGECVAAAATDRPASADQTTSA